MQVNTECYETLVVLQIVYEKYQMQRRWSQAS